MESGENHCRRRELGWQKKNQDSMMKGFRNNHLPSVVVPPNPVARQFRAEEDVPAGDRLSGHLLRRSAIWADWYVPVYIATEVRARASKHVGTGSVHRFEKLAILFY